MVSDPFLTAASYNTKSSIYREAEYTRWKSDLSFFLEF